MTEDHTTRPTRDAAALRGHAAYPEVDGGGPLVAAAAAVRAGTGTVGQLVTELRRATLYCEAPETPGVMTAQTPSGPVVPVYTTLAQLAAARGPAAWSSTTGEDLLPQLPDGHDVLVDPAGPSPLLLRRGLWTGAP